MKQSLVFLLILSICFGCSHHSKHIDKSVEDSISMRKLDSGYKTAKAHPDDLVEETFDEVKANLFKTYNKIKKTDTTIIDNNDTLTIHFKYYCLHDSSVTIPAKYVWGTAEKKDFITNSFASKILIIKNRDTIFNKIIYKNDFNAVVTKEEKKYATMVDADFQQYDKTKGIFLFGYTISIPITDLGRNAYLTINKSGQYTIHDEYYKNE